MLRMECYTTTEGLVVTVIGFDTRPILSSERLSSAVATTTILTEHIEEYGLERVVAQAVAEALETFPGITELALM